ncbi:MAG TPA: archease [Candidatus Humimicrobiaceae bacterium]|nr:archease [Candidatus Humimicrobiaceae bacterium]
MKKYKILEHKADLKIRAFGENKKELFLNMLSAMAKSQKPEIKITKKVKRKIKINSPDLSALLVDFLNEALYLSQVNKEVYSSVIFKKITDRKVEGELTGQKLERFGEDIKAVTYHNLDIHQLSNGGWEANVLFDI